MVEELEDFATLEAALTFIDEYEDSTTSSSLMDSSQSDDIEEKGAELSINCQLPSVAIQKPISGKRNTNRNKCPEMVGVVPSRNFARDKRKREILQLRAECVELEKRLHQLRHLVIPDRISYTEANSETRPEHLRQLQKKLVMVWKDVAERHYRLRKAAEAENNSLREQLATQLRIAKNLERAIRKQTASENKLAVPSTKFRYFFRKLYLSNKPVLLSELVEELTMLYLDTDHVLMAFSLYGDQYPFSETRMNQKSATKFEIEVTNARIIPFDYMDITSAFWKYGCVDYEDSPDIYVIEQEISQSMIKRVYSAEYADGKFSMGFQGGNALRRFIEENRVVYVFSCWIKLIEICGQPVHDIEVTQKGWFVVQKADPAMPDVTVMQACAQITIDTKTDQPDRNAQVKMLANVLTNQMKEGINFTVQTVEDTLLGRERDTVPVANIAHPEISSYGLSSVASLPTKA